MDVRTYYDREAARYQQRVSSGLLGKLRERERAAVMELLEPRAGDHILDAGCGTGFDAVPLMERGCLVDGVDISPRMVDSARERGVDAVVADLHDFDLGRRYDKVLCAGPLEFCESIGRVIERLAAHTAPGGRVVLFFPTPSPLGFVYRAWHRTHGLKIRLYGVAQMSELLRAAGLEPDGVRRPGQFAVLRARAPGPA